VIKDRYKIRYVIEPWDKPVPGPVTPVGDGQSVSADNSGYADYLFVVSGVEAPDGNLESMMVADTRRGVGASRAAMVAIRDLLNHLLDHPGADPAQPVLMPEMP
jgi:hypothetical protein